VFLVVAAIVVGVVVRYWPSKQGGPRAPAVAAISDKSIAVLPFTDMSEKKDQEYFADGMAEEILDLLAKIPALKVIGRTSSFQFKGHNEDLRAIGTKLDVAYVLEGSVRKSGDRVRVTAQLVDTRDGAHVWSETYDRDAGDVLRMQDEIAIALVPALQLTMGADALSSRPSMTNVEAHDLYLRGRFAVDRFDKEGFEVGASYLQKALSLDPTFADAALALSLTYFYQTNWGFIPTGVGYEQARRAVQATLKLDPSRGQAHAILALIHTYYDWDWVAADRELKMTMELQPRDPIVLGVAANLALTLGNYAGASRMFKEALTRDPLVANAYVMLSWAQIRMGQTAEAEASLRRALEVQPGYVWAPYYLGIALLLRGDLDAALAAVRRDAPLAQAAGLPIVYWALGRKAEAEAALRKLIAERANDAAYEIAEVYAYRSDRDEAFKWLERAYAQKDGGLHLIKGDPLLTNLEPDPRFKAFLKKMNLPE
jgi:TolB-like protein/Flp pilus assembly protein TadD